MSASKKDLRDFQRFADEKLSNGGANAFVELASAWQAHRREIEETIDDIRASHADIDAGRISPVPDTFADVRRQLRL